MFTAITDKSKKNDLINNLKMRIMKRTLLMLLMMLSTLCAMSSSSVKINGITLSSSTAPRTLTGTKYGITYGKIVWTPLTRVLELNGLAMELENTAIEIHSTETVTIKIVGSANIQVNADKDAMILNGGNYKIVSSNPEKRTSLILTVNSEKSYCAALYASASSVTFENCKVSLRGPAGLWGALNVKITADRTTINARGSLSGSIRDIGSLDMKWVRINTTKYAHSFSELKSGVVLNGELSKQPVNIYRYYDLKVMGNEVNELNQDDVTGDGTVQFVEPGKLKLTGSHLTHATKSIIEFGNNLIDPTLIVGKGVSYLESGNINSVISSSLPLTVLGSSESPTPNLRVSSTNLNQAAGISCAGDLTLSNMVLNIGAPIPLLYSRNSYQLGTLTFDNCLAVLSCAVRDIPTTTVAKDFSRVVYNDSYLWHPKSAVFNKEGFFYLGEKQYWAQVHPGYDEIAPVIPNKTVEIESITKNTVTLKWNAAEDNLVPASNLKYSVLVRTSPDDKVLLQTAEAGAGVTRCEITGLRPDTKYYMQVAVEDEYGNISYYDQVRAWTDYEIYNITIRNDDIDQFNAHDVFGDGTVSYDPEKRILTLNNFKETTPGSIRIGEPDVTLRIVGQNYIVFDPDMLHGINATQPLTIEGYSPSKSKLTVQGNVRTCGDLNIRNCTCDFSSMSVSHVFASGKALSLNLSNVTLHTSFNIDALVGSNQPFDNVVMENSYFDNNMKVTYDTSKKCFADRTGKQYETVKIESVPIIVNGKPLTPENESVLNGLNMTFDRTKREITVGLCNQPLNICTLDDVTVRINGLISCRSGELFKVYRGKLTLVGPIFADMQNSSDAVIRNGANEPGWNLFADLYKTELLLVNGLFDFNSYGDCIDFRNGLVSIDNADFSCRSKGSGLSLACKQLNINRSNCLPVLPLNLDTTSPLDGRIKELKIYRIVPGRINYDESIDMVDLYILIDYLNGKIHQNIIIEGLDVNQDGKVDKADVDALVQYLLNKS